MSSGFALIAFVAALNPARTRLGLPEDGDGRARPAPMLGGVVVGTAGLIGVAWLADGLLSSLEISPETFRIAAGFVLVVVAAWMMFVPVPPEEPVPESVWAALWPVAFPRFLSPEAITLALTVGASDGLDRSVAGVALASAAILGLGYVRVGERSGRILGAFGRLAAAVLMIVGVWLAVQGVREI